ncbi:hypothetical protein MBCUT_04160 [Methanobrevibacter cuticularis]|uniref:DUF357 domain-containing protein n=1 Tax=Methanobrevibacter cuticularis TaxID=47311 RepID=A0A166EU31_9EURY|nr:DUF357 domain-containing protein [Methanobrevibacter cuticularis]KZX17013.1 hypothetical protein MBCUT_04160 [Methanobrevibacter cuticularis]
MIDNLEWKEKILKDIDKLDTNLDEIKKLDFKEKEKEAISRAKDYREDCKYYLEKGDEITSFECISYSHGLIDTLRIIYNII